MLGWLRSLHSNLHSLEIPLWQGAHVPLECIFTIRTMAISNCDFAYIKFLQPCRSETLKHKSAHCIVPVKEIVNFEKFKKNKNREFKVNCGSSTCLAVIGLTGSKYILNN